MDTLKKQRRNLRMAFTKAHSAFLAKMASGSREEQLVAFQLLESKMTELDSVHAAYNQLLFQSQTSDEDIAKEIETDDGYKTTYLTAKLRTSEICETVSEHVPAGANVTAPAARKTLKLPTIELPKFSGNVKEWLPFWSVFKKIHEDASIRKEDRFQYLIQATVPKSRAHDLVSSFPPTAENYDKVIASLKNRFGRDDVVVEFYVRELLGLVLQNAIKGREKSSLANIYDKIESYIRALNTLGVTTDKCAAMLYPLVESSLPEEVLRAWQRSGSRETEAVDANGQRHLKDRLTRLLEFLQLEVESQERIDMALKGFDLPAETEKSRKTKTKGESTKEPASASALLTSREEKQIQCVFCHGKHESNDCEAARKMNINERKECVKKENACFVCMKRGHISKKCKVKVKCNWCSKHHDLLMCPVFSTKENNANRPSENKNIENSLAASSESPKVCLQTLRVKLYSDTQEKIVRAIFDSASQRSYIRADIARELNYMPCDEIEVAHSLFGGIKSKAEKHDIFKARLKNLDGSYACNFSVLSKETICETIPIIKKESWVDELRKRNIILSDIESQRESIDILIGADVTGKLLTGKKYQLKNGLTAFETLLGWTIMGKLTNARSEKTDSAIMFTTMLAPEADISELWRLDTIGITDPLEKTDRLIRERATHDYIMETSKVTAEGRYEVRLPWRDDHAPLPNNLEIAQRRLKTTVEKLNKQGLFSAYDNIFEEWLKENIIEKIPDDEIHHTSHYLPHRPVIKHNSTTKIRPVFDASAKKDGHPSLNQCLEKGPNLMELVSSSLNRFRERQIGVISDIKGAFLQIAVEKTDRDFLRFLWIVNDKVTAFRHCRVVFGLSCSPFLLSATTELLLEAALKKADETNESVWTKNSVVKLKESFYVDNCVTSVDTVEDLQIFVREATEIMALGGFDLRGWEHSGDFSDREDTLVLGILWNKCKDRIALNPMMMDIDLPESVTKRIILSAANKVFDPIGFSCPVSLQPKLLLAKLWEEKFDWDEKIEDQRAAEFVRWAKDIPLLKQIELPRKLGDGKLTIHAFGDASGLAYAAVIFARVEAKGSIDVQLLSARSRIAPKKATIPRLELMAASITARLADTVVKSLTRNVEKVTFWSDSTTVLAWLNRDTQWGAFVYNRIKEIKSLSSTDQWRYVPGILNPADLPSRGCTPSQLINSDWWRGPNWLRKPESEWPSMERIVDESEVNKEVKKSALTQMVAVHDSEFKASDLFSEYTKLLRFMAWTRRFIRNRKVELEERKKYKNDKSCVVKPYLSKEKRKNLYLTFQEVKDAEISLLRYLQEIMFKKTERNKLSSFKTLLDENGLYVLKTKIVNRDDDRNFVCPVILDKHNIVELLVDETHKRCGHSGTQIVMNAIRERFWIISLRRIIRSVTSKCVICKKHKAKRMECETPPLPVNRVRDAAVFEITGVDFAGPVFVKGEGKTWICIFTCAVYRAVHLELATSLSVTGFTECLRRFIARRGRPRFIYCDNGKNFTGTANALQGLNWEKIVKCSSAFQIEWRFNPPSAPWWGGWWERLIGVVKSLLRKILGKASLTYESLVTSLCDAESIINSRPLTYVSEDPEDPKPLSPSMFLQEIREIGAPDLDMLYHEKLNKKLRYRQKILNDLRTRFRAEYLSQLLIKGGKKETRTINIGDVVLIGDDARKRIEWPLARVVNTIAGRDGQVRVYLLKTKNGLLKRPIQRIYPLEIEQSSNEFVEHLNRKTCKFAEDTKNVSTSVQCETTAERNIEESEPRVNVKEGVAITRSGRVSKRPDRLMY